MYEVLKLLIYLSVLILLSACHAERVPYASQAVSTTDITWTVELHVTGGFAGIDRSIYVDNHSRVIISDASHKLLIKTNLHPEQRDEVEALLPQGELVSPKSSNRCRDCFSYNLTFRSEGVNGRFQANDSNLNQTKTRMLIHKLMSIQNDLIRRHNKKDM